MKFDKKWTGYDEIEQLLMTKDVAIVVESHPDDFRSGHVDIQIYQQRLFSQGLGELLVQVPNCASLQDALERALTLLGQAEVP